ncbi:MAG TPA: sodium-dependent transporter [Tissierellia bacterium]|nr:sodium-dependent transporter [Tissierellia bacterium]
MERERFSSRLGLILTTIGFAVGVGNLWRFPYITGIYGGGVFLAFYIVMIILIGIPLLVAEMSLGKAAQKSPVGAYKILSPGKPWFLNGYLHMIAAVLIISYTLPIYAWIIHYFYKTLLGSFVGMGAEAIGAHFEGLIENPGYVILLAVINLALTLAVVLRQLQKGVEKIAKILLPCLFVLIIILIIRGLTLPGALEGISFYLKPDFSLFTGEGALAAIGQVFFSVGIGMAAAFVFGSYMKKEDGPQLIPNGVLIALADTLAAFLAGFMIFPAVFAFGLEPSAGPGLVFVTMPNVFNLMPAGTFWGSLFYLGFYIAAFTSAIAVWEAVIAFFRDEFNFTRTKSAVITLVLVVIIGFSSIISMELFEFIDYIENNFFLVFGALLMTIFVGWFWGIDNFSKEVAIEKESNKKLWAFLLKFLAPIIIIVLALNLFGVV